jgi:hypothetical protein
MKSPVASGLAFGHGCVVVGEVGVAFAVSSERAYGVSELEGIRSSAHRARTRVLGVYECERYQLFFALFDLEF